jgi:hypothetical protein
MEYWEIIADNLSKKKPDGVGLRLRAVYREGRSNDSSFRLNADVASLSIVGREWVTQKAFPRLVVILLLGDTLNFR